MTRWQEHIDLQGVHFTNTGPDPQEAPFFDPEDEPEGPNAAWYEPWPAEPEPFVPRCAWGCRNTPEPGHNTCRDCQKRLEIEASKL